MNLIVNQINYWLIKEDNFTKKTYAERFENNDILMYSTHNDSNSVIAERFIKKWKRKKKKTANDSKSYLSYLNKLVDQYNNN